MVLPIVSGLYYLAPDGPELDDWVISRGIGMQLLTSVNIDRWWSMDSMPQYHGVLARQGLDGAHP